MQDYVKTHRGGASVIMTRPNYPAGMYEVKLYSSGGGLVDKVRCDDYREALTYRRAFNAQARSMA